MDRTSGTPVPPESFSFSAPSSLALGAVFTPARWARFAVERSGLLDAWLGGATILDPTMGQGHLLEAFVDLALARGISADSLPFDRLFGVEICPEIVGSALTRFRQRFGAAMDDQFLCADFFTAEVPPCDFVVGNPPWINFADLPEALKPLYRERFLASGLISDHRAMLLGFSRMDVAALIIQRALERHLAPRGQAWFFLPLSLLLNDGAHAGFRRYRAGSRPFTLAEVWDFGPGVFPGVSTRHGLVHFRIDEDAQFPIPYHQWDGQGWASTSASPAFWAQGSLSLLRQDGKAPWALWTPLSIEARSRPRQGLNTGGANHVFLFSDYEELAGGFCRVDGVLLPKAFVHPVLPSAAFGDPLAPAQRWVLIPYGPVGAPLTEQELASHPSLDAYLRAHRSTLENRRGVLLQSWRRRGVWWALLGVGAYSFAPFKVFWQAYGSDEFRAIVRSGLWQANQALQAFIPCWSEAEARRIAQRLGEPLVAEILRATNTQGTKSWAQPGRIRALLREE